MELGALDFSLVIFVLFFSLQFLLYILSSSWTPLSCASLEKVSSIEPKAVDWMQTSPHQKWCSRFPRYLPRTMLRSYHTYHVWSTTLVGKPTTELLWDDIQHAQTGIQLEIPISLGLGVLSIFEPYVAILQSDKAWANRKPSLLQLSGALLQILRCLREPSQMGFIFTPQTFPWDKMIFPLPLLPCWEWVKT